MTREIYAVGEIPPLGVVPPKMHAQVIRAARYGQPIDAFRMEQVPTPRPGPREALILVMAAGINYNNVWAARGVPVDVIKARQKAGEPEDFHVGGSDASGIVYALGEGAQGLKVGDEVVIHCGQWDRADPFVEEGGDPIVSATNKIWGYESNWGSFAQFARVQDHQCVPKPRQLCWEQAAAYMLVGATAYRMLLGWPEHRVRAGDVVLIWGASGGLGSQAIQIARSQGAIPVAVIGDDAKAGFCLKLGARGVINRKRFDHWGMLPHWKDEAAMARFVAGAQAFGKAIWDVVGEKKNPRIVFEHPGEDTLPTSCYVCARGGMVVICAGTSGFNATLDLRHHWMRQKRLQGSHFANDDQARGLNALVSAGQVDPCLSERVFRFEEIPAAHQLMHENKHPAGNMAALVSAPRTGMGRSA